MAELKANLGPYRLKVALEADRQGANCFVLDVGHDEDGNQVASLDHVNEIVYKYISNIENLYQPTTKLYVVGDWNVTPKEERPETEGLNHPMDKLRVKSRAEQEWYEASKKIAKLVDHMPGLKELTWMAGLPFMSMMWETLSTSLTKLIIDLGQPVRVEQDGDIEYKSYITQSKMKPLVQQTQLKELRLFRMHDSMQPVIWEAIFRNVAESGVRVADLQMAAEPIVRANHWHKAENVVGLTVPKQDSKEQEYKGIEGKGVLHHSFGTGEYLDAFCMRKARIAAGLDELKPLPLWCLKLDGFVVDYLPFEHELSRIALLTCGNDCIDSGLRAPKTPCTPHNRWGKIVNNAPSHCLIQWPNWTGVFDDHGHQRDNHGAVVSQETGLSTPANELPSPSPAPLTKEFLHRKDLGDALDEADKNGGCSAALPEVVTEAAATTPTTMASDVSICGSEEPTPSVGTAGRSSPKLSLLDGSASSGTISPMIRSQILGDEGMMESMISTDSSFDHVSPRDVEAGSYVAAHDYDGTASDSKSESKTGIFKHKVRRSLEWLSGSRSGSGEAF